MDLRIGMWIGAALLAAVPATGVAQEPVDVELGGYAHFQFNTSSVDDAALTTWETRRVRWTVSVEVDDWITAQLQPDFAMGDLGLADAWMNFALTDGIELRVGQFKRPFSRIELNSSTRTLPIESGVRIRGFDGLEEYRALAVLGYLGRDLGAALHGGLGGFGYQVGIFNGAGADDLDGNDTESFGARLTYALLPQLEIGAGAMYREVGEDPHLEGTAFELDAEWGAFMDAGPHLVAEVAFADNLAGGELLGAQAIAAWFVPAERDRIAGIEPLVRVSWADPVLDLDGDGGTLITPGVNVYFFGRNRLMVNWDVFLSTDTAVETANALRIQTQLVF